MIITGFIILFVLMIMYRFLQLSSITSITEKNVRFISDLLERSSPSNRMKMIQLIDWHKQYHHPFLVERSYKIHEKDKSMNNDRFAVFIDLGCFLTGESIDNKKWIHFSNIIKMPLSIEKTCIEYMMTGKDQVDFIWGLDPVEQKEKIYLEFPNKGTIESYIVENGKILDVYEYTRSPTKNVHASFMYIRRDRNGIIDSYHYALKKPIIKRDHTIYIVSYSPVNHTKTYYYRCL
jgi:hypothetical protein